MQGDGNLVLPEKMGSRRQARWASDTMGNPGARAIMQLDGNLVVYTAGNQPIWASRTEEHPGAVVVLQDDRNVVVYATDGRPLWASNTSNAVRIDDN
jgi:hypothetical protein